MKKLLVVGDFRDCINYGAIATTEALLKMINENYDDYEVETISYRSFLKKTPDEGWNDTAEVHLGKLMNIPSYKKIVKRILYNTKLLNRFNLLKMKVGKVKIKDTKRKYHIPVKYKEFDSYIMKASDILRYEKTKLESADIILINAEGSIVRGTDEDGVYRVGGLYCLFIAYWATKISKPCYVINHTIDPQNRDIFMMIKNIYPKLSGIVVREPKSKVLLDEMGIKDVLYYPDTLFAYEQSKDFEVNDYVQQNIDFSKPYICIGDSSGLSASGIRIKWDVVNVYSKIITELKKICPQIIFIDGFSGKNEDILKVIRVNKIASISLENADYHNLYYVLKRSELFISGRWHSSILALIAGTPILLWGSDSHKTEALYEMIEYPYRFFDINTLPINIDELVEEVQLILKNDNSEYIERAKKLALLAEHNLYMLDGSNDE